MADANEITPSETNEQQRIDSEFDNLLNDAVLLDGGELGDNGEITQHTGVDVEPQISTEELFLPVISASCDIFLSDWDITNKEKQALTAAYCPVIDKYFPDAGGVFGVELTALLTTAMIVAPRLKAKAEQDEEDKAQVNEAMEHETPLQVKPLTKVE